MGAMHGSLKIVKIRGDKKGVLTHPLPSHYFVERGNNCQNQDGRDWRINRICGSIYHPAEHRYNLIRILISQFNTFTKPALFSILKYCFQIITVPCIDHNLLICKLFGISRN